MVKINFEIKTKTCFSSNIITLFNNHGDRDLNKRILDKIGYKEYARRILADFHDDNRHYVLINLSADVNCNALRVSTNLFNEKIPHVLFY